MGGINHQKWLFYSGFTHINDHSSEVADHVSALPSRHGFPQTHGVHVHEDKLPHRRGKRNMTPMVTHAMSSHIYQI